MKRLKVAVTGAAGQIGYALLFRMAAGEMFGKEVSLDLNLLELEVAIPALRGVVMEIEDCAFPLVKAIRIFSDPVQAFEGIDWAILVGSVPRKAGMERADLLKINGKVFVQQGEALNMSAKKNCRVLVVGNPCNTNAFIAKEKAKNISPKNFYAMTMLDEKRAIAQVARKANVEITEIKNMAVWGNHSTTMFPDFYHAKIKEKAVLEVIKDEKWLQTSFLEVVQKRGAEIIKARGLSSAASAANAVIETVKRIEEPTRQDEFFSAAVAADGSYGIPEGIMFSYPIIMDGRWRWQVVQNIQHNDFAMQKINETCQELISERDVIKEII